MTSDSALPSIGNHNGQGILDLEQSFISQPQINSQKAIGDNALQISASHNQVTAAQYQAKSLNDIPNAMIPEELLFSLKHSEQLVCNKKGSDLAPLKDTKTQDKLRMALKKGPPSNVWHHKSRRNKFKHLTDYPHSMGKGVGTRDISFLYDVVHKYEPAPPVPSKLDKSAVRMEASEEKKPSKLMAVPDTVIPEEYHLVKTKAVLGLEYIDENQTTLAGDAEKTLRVFPSLKPNKRFEVIQLLKTLEVMLEESGVTDDSVEVKGPTQIHNLLELIKKEQTIYDLVFSEVIRQVSVDCVERGQLLSRLRQNYADLLNRIPRQIQSLHSEVMAQRSLDRRLTDELVRFKSSISFLTKELQSVREHDHTVTMEAQVAEEELAKALRESQTNANLVDEYHNLYELQRKRLEASVADLTTERDLWSNAAYNLALKITTANSLNTAKRLHVSEKAWSKLANHFTVLLSDYDSECLTEMQSHVEKWRSIMFQFRQELERADRQTVGLLTNVRSGLQKWMQKFDDTLVEVTADARFIKEPPNDFVEGLCEFFKRSEELLGLNGERYAGGTLLGNEEKILAMIGECDAWTGMAWIVYRRHKSDSDAPFPLSETMKDVNTSFHQLSKQLQTRFSGENGVAKGMMNIQNAFDGWTSKLTLQLLGSDPLKDTDWLALHERLEDYITLVNDTLSFVDSQQLEDDRIAGLPHQQIIVDDIMSKVHDWMRSTINQIEAEDGKLMAKVSTIHIHLVRWMVQMLLNLVPNYEEPRRGAKIKPSMATIWTVKELVENAHSIASHLTDFTEYASQCCTDIVQISMQKKRDHGDDDAEHEYRDFMRLKMEAVEWIRSCEFLLMSVRSGGSPIMTPEITRKLQLPKDEIDRQAHLPPLDNDKSTIKDDSTESISRDFGGAKKLTPSKASDSAAENDVSASTSAKPESSPAKTDDASGKSLPEVPKSDSTRADTIASDSQAENLETSAPANAESDSSVKDPTPGDQSKPGEADTSSKAAKPQVEEKLPQKPGQAKKAKGKNKKAAGSTVSKADDDGKSKAEDSDKATTTEDEEEEEEEKDDQEMSEAEKKPDPEMTQQDQEETLSGEVAMDDAEQVGKIQYNKLGKDENIHLATLEDAEDTKNEDHLVRPTSSLMQSAYDAIAKMDSLQHELLNTEIRAQDAEKKIIDMQEQLNLSNEKIRAFEKRIALLEGADTSSPATPQNDGANKEADAKSIQDTSDSPENKAASGSRADSARRKGKTATKPKKQGTGKKK